MTQAAPVEARAARRAADGGVAKQRLRLWLRLLRVSRGIEAELRERLRIEFQITLPQFDVMSALARRSEGVNMTKLSRYLMVSNGNATVIVERLVKDGLVERRAVPGDRRATIVQLSAKGGAIFDAMAARHEAWVDELLGTFTKSEVAALIGQLDGLVDRLRPREPRADRIRKGDNAR